MKITTNAIIKFPISEPDVVDATTYITKVTKITLTLSPCAQEEHRFEYQHRQLVNELTQLLQSVDVLFVEDVIVTIGDETFCHNKMGWSIRVLKWTRDGINVRPDGYTWRYFN